MLLQSILTSQHSSSIMVKCNLHDNIYLSPEDNYQPKSADNSQLSEYKIAVSERQ
jgi:hypothetical protein